MAGFGGQGILLIGDILAQAGMMMGRHVTWMPSYGVEMRGGTANTTVVISDKRIGSPITGRPHGVIAMNGPSLEKFAPWLRPVGCLIANKSMCESNLLKRDDVDAVFVPCVEIATEAGDSKASSMVALGAFVEKTQSVTYEAICQALESYLSGKKAKFIPLNQQAVKKGMEFASSAR
ncbi:MAG: 2-oxoacid:acceptor oxidoreductase family protein [Candidatus Omnitrophota bacterium]